MGPKLMYCYRVELEEGRVPAKEAKNWRIEEKKNYEKGVSEAGKQVLNGRFNGATTLWNLAREQRRERGELLKEEGDTVRENKAMHEEKFLSSWLREDGGGKKKGWQKRRRKKKKRVKREKREEEKEDNETGTVKRRCQGCFFCGGI